MKIFFLINQINQLFYLFIYLFSIIFSIIKNIYDSKALLMWNRSSFWRFASAFISQGCAGTADQRACALYGHTHTHTTRTHMLTAWVHHALSLQFTGEINPKRLSLLTPVSPSPQPSIHPSISSLHLHQQMCPFIIFCQVPSCLSLSFSLLSVYVSPICGPQHWSTTCMLYLRFPFSLCILTQVLLA